ncbi:hypothetical protein, partial [Lysobacter sp. ISL-54]|uniref:hypothetical protein n=1 Tax=Lysobacter sp. ISL-54 TaxID=2819155 RepID=UPI001BE8DB3C
ARAGGAGDAARGPGNDWPSVLATLIDHGFDWPWIERATSRQLSLFYRIAVQRERALRADRVEDINAGFAGGRDVTAFIQKLRNPL